MRTIYFALIPLLAIAASGQPGTGFIGVESTLRTDPPSSGLRGKFNVLVPRTKSIRVGPTFFSRILMDRANHTYFGYELFVEQQQPGDYLATFGKLGVTPLDLAGSGNLVHNLHAYAWGRHVVEPYDWAVRFERQTREMIGAREHGPLVDYERLGRDARLSIPTPDHYLPLLYVIAARQERDAVSFSVEGVDGGSISMLSVMIG